MVQLRERIVSSFEFTPYQASHLKLSYKEDSLKILVSNQDDFEMMLETIQEATLQKEKLLIECQTTQQTQPSSIEQNKDEKRAIDNKIPETIKD